MRRMIGGDPVAGHERSWYSGHQVLTYGFFIVQNWVYEMCQGKWQEISLVRICLEIWHYILVGFIIWQLKEVRGCDTRDPILKGLSSESQFEECELSYCVMCNSIILKTSYHCWKCNQCSDSIDHHCKYLNCCIAQENYVAFLRLLSVFILYNLDYLVVVAGKRDSGVLKWMVVGGSMVEFCLALGLMGFHVYLRHFQGNATKDFCLKVRINSGMAVERRDSWMDVS